MRPCLAVFGAALCLGASCSDKHAENASEPARAQERATPAERVESLAQVDITQLTHGEKTLWVELVNDQLSPCGEPVSVGRCVKENRACRACVSATRYLKRLVTEGYPKAEIEEFYKGRYARDRQVEIETEHAPVRGAPGAAVSLVEFSDFECPHCGAAHPVIETLLRELDGQVRLLFLHYPLEAHLHALPAARAAIAAGNQGKFWEMHDLLFAHQDALEDTQIEQYAQGLGLGMERFRADMAADVTERRVERDKEVGRTAGVVATPSIFVNGRLFDEPLRALSAYVREELDQ